MRMEQVMGMRLYEYVKGCASSSFDPYIEYIGSEIATLSYIYAFIKDQMLQRQRNRQKHAPLCITQRSFWIWGFKNRKSSSHQISSS